MEKIPENEIHDRIARFQSILSKKDMDGALLMQNVDIYYFSGTLQTSILFIPREGKPIFMSLKNEERARAESPIQNIVSLKGRKKVAETLKDYGHDQFHKLGIEMDVLPANLYLWLNRHLKADLWENISGEILRLRMIKSDYEIEQFRKASQILRTGFLEIQEFIRPGMTELAVDGRLANIARREGHMGILRMRGWNQEITYAHVLSGESGAVPTFLDSPHGGSGNTPAMAQGAGFRKIKKNEPIGIDFGVAVNGYIGDQFRTYVAGSLSKKLEKAHECSKAILKILSKKAKPGTNCPDLFAIARKKAEQEGLGEYFMGHGKSQARFVGHGIGLEIDEYPVISPGFDMTLKENMVMAIEPKFVFPGEGVVGLEDDYIVTASGLKRITLTDQKIMTVAN